LERPKPESEELDEENVELNEQVGAKERNGVNQK